MDFLPLDVENIIYRYVHELLMKDVMDEMRHAGHYSNCKHSDKIIHYHFMKSEHVRKNGYDSAYYKKYSNYWKFYYHVYSSCDYSNACIFNVMNREPGGTDWTRGRWISKNMYDRYKGNDPYVHRDGYRSFFPIYNIDKYY